MDSEIINEIQLECSQDLYNFDNGSVLNEGTEQDTLYYDSIRSRLAWMVKEMGYDVINEAKAPQVGSGKVRIYFERDSDDGLHEYRGYYAIVFYIDKKMTDAQREVLARGFLQEFRGALSLNLNNIYAIQRIYFAGSMFIDMDVRNLEGFKMLYGIRSKG